MQGLDPHLLQGFVGNRHLGWWEGSVWYSFRFVEGKRGEREARRGDGGVGVAGWWCGLLSIS